MSETLDDAIISLRGVSDRLELNDYDQRLLSTDLLIVTNALLQVCSRIQVIEDYEFE